MSTKQVFLVQQSVIWEMEVIGVPWTSVVSALCPLEREQHQQSAELHTCQKYFVTQLMMDLNKFCFHFTSKQVTLKAYKKLVL